MARSKKVPTPKEFTSDEILVNSPQEETPQETPQRVYGFDIGSKIWIGRYMFNDAEDNLTLDQYIRISKIPINDFKEFTFTENGKKWLDSIPDDKISIDGDIISVEAKV